MGKGFKIMFVCVCKLFFLRKKKKYPKVIWEGVQGEQVEDQLQAEGGCTLVQLRAIVMVVDILTFLGGFIVGMGGVKEGS